MPRLPGIGQQDAVRVFQKLGYRIVRQSGHIVMSNGNVRLVIPRKFHPRHQAIDAFPVQIRATE